MRRQSQEEAAAAARRRLELLGRELAQAGLGPPLRPPGDPEQPFREETGAPDLGTPEPWPAPPAPGEPAPLTDAGRHARRRRASLAGRASGWLEDRLPPALHGRVALGSAQLAVVACLLAVGLAVAAVVVLRSGAAGQPVPLVHGSGGTGVPVAGGTGTASTLPSATPSGSPGVSSGTAAGGAAPGTVVVDVAGKVRRPGIASLPAGSRVVDALRRAGGARPGVDLSSLNLARVLVDGEQILVGVAAAPGAAASAASVPSAGAVPGQLVNLNTATLEQLDSLPGVGPVTAQKIVDWRTQHQQFSSVDELLEIDGIGEKTLADLAPFVTL